MDKEQKTPGAFIKGVLFAPGDHRYLVLTGRKENSMRTLVAKNPSEARGIRKALKAAGMKFEFKSTRAGVRKKRNPSKKRRTRAARERAALKALQKRARAYLAPRLRVVSTRKRKKR